MSRRQCALIRVPDVVTRPEDHLRLPPLGILTLAAFLEAHGVDVRVHDLDVAPLPSRLRIAAVSARPSRPGDMEAPSTGEVVGYWGPESLRAVLSHSPELLTSCNPEATERNILGDEEPWVSEFADSLLADLDLRDAALVGFSLQSYFSPLLSASVTGALARRIGANTGVRMVLGGRGLHFLSGHILQALLRHIDAIVPGPGCRPLLALWQHYSNGCPALAEIPGILAMDNGVLVVTGPGSTRRPRDREPLLLPAFSRAEMSAYRHRIELRWDSGTNGRPQHIEVGLLPLYFMTGCRFACTFCVQGGLPLVSLPPEEAADHVVEASRVAGLSDILLLNSQINHNRDYAHRFCRRLISLGTPIRWSDSAGFDSLDRETLELMSTAGCVRLWFGLESPEDGMLRRIGKRTTVARAEECLAMARDLGLWVGVNFIVGLPYEPPEAGARIVRFVRRNQDRLEMWELNKFHLLGGPYHLAPDHFGIRLRGRRPWSPFVAFDEIHGLSWPEKSIQGEREYRSVLSELDVAGNAAASNPHLISGLGPLAGDRSRLRSWISTLRDVRSGGLSLLPEPPR